jgi:carbon-monoxide dehydrogenase medium subunit
MYNFNYQSASSADDAAAKIGGADDGTFLAGGQTILPTMKQRLAGPSDLVDLSGAGLSGISADGGGVTIGAMTRHADVASSGDVQSALPGLAALAGGIGDPQVRNRGTIGGSIANNDPAADYPAAVLGLGATIKTNKREIAGDDFFTGMFDTALEDGELITAVSFPGAEKSAYAKFANPASRFAIVGVFVAQTGGGTRVAVTGAGPCVFRVADMEAALTGNWSAGALDGISVSADGLNSDIHAAADYRAHLVTVMAKRAVAAAG